MNILVTGGSGFLGSNVCLRLLADGHHVWAVDTFVTGQNRNIEHTTQNKNFVFKQCSIESEDFLAFCRTTGAKFDCVFHCACPTGVPNIETLGEEMLLTCSIGTSNVLKVAKEHGSRLLFTSSSEVYGNPLVSPQPEEYTGNVDPVGWRANYEEGKRFSETWVMLYVRKYNLNARIVRLFNVYGPRMSSVDFRVVPRFVTQTLKGDPVTVHGTGLQTRTMCFVDDIVEGLLTVIEKGDAGQVYNLGSDQPVSMLDLAKKIIDLTNSPSTIAFTERAGHDHDSRMPVLTKVRSLGWKQKFSLDEGLLRTIDYFRSLKDLPSKSPSAASVEYTSGAL